MRRTAAFLFVAVLAAAGWFGWALYTPTVPPAQTFVLLHPGYSTHRIAAELKNAGIIRSEDAFIFLHYIHHGRSLKAGEYLFDKPASMLDVQRRISHGDVYVRTVVVPEGYTMFDIARAIESAGLGKADDFLKVAQTDTSLIADLSPNAASLEGYLFPDTYDFNRLMTMQEMAAAMVKQFRQVARQIGLTTGPQLIASHETVSEGDPANSVQDGFQGGDIERTVTMASIVEKETAVPAERALVASVYYNRLAKNVALDADPSIIYAELLAGTYGGALHHADVQFDSPYNTYRHAGLPPGPIGNPGRSALEAAMHPAQSEFFYFVADAQGHHRFARTIEEHNKNVAAYRQAMRSH